MFITCVDFFITHICTLMYLHEYIFVEFSEIYEDLIGFKKNI